MNSVVSLDVFLYGDLIGKIVQLAGDKNLFTFQDEYIEEQDRPVLSLSFRDSLGDLVTDVKSTRTRLSPFFSNLLPEGYLRKYLAALAKVSFEREFYLLSELGSDLSGALTVKPSSALSTLKLRVVLARKRRISFDRKCLSIRNTKALAIVKIRQLWRRTTHNLNIDRALGNRLLFLYCRKEMLSVKARTVLCIFLWRVCN